jgi:hypothetical protein
MDGIDAEQDWNTEPRVFRQLLKFDRRLSPNVQERTHATLSHLGFGVLAPIGLHHLPDLLLEGHATHQVADAVFGAELGIEVG